MVKQQNIGLLKSALNPRRLFWGFVLLVHVWGLHSIWTSMFGESGAGSRLSYLVRLLSMSVAAAFFVLKIVDLPCLRLKPGWQTVLVMVVALALIHVGAVQRFAGDNVEISLADLGIVLFVCGFCDYDWIRKSAAKLSAAQKSIRLQRRRHFRSDCLWQRPWDKLRRPVFPIVLPDYCRPRPPPIGF